MENQSHVCLQKSKTSNALYRQTLMGLLQEDMYVPVRELCPVINVWKLKQLRPEWGKGVAMALNLEHYM